MHSPQQLRQAFTRWLRTGWLPPARSSDGTELKYNPWHDPRDGRFTFAPGGARGGKVTGELRPAPPHVARNHDVPMRVGRNAQAMQRAMTLEQVLPGLRTAPGGAIIAVADNFLNFSGPATDAQLALVRTWSQQVEGDILALDPAWRLDRLGPNDSLQGQLSALNDLRFERAKLHMMTNGDPRPMQVETLRFVQEQADLAYRDGMALLREGKLTLRLSRNEALGNYIDRQVRLQLRRRYNTLGIDSAGAGPVRVNRRENDTSATDATLRRPDARVGDVAFDITIAHKTLRTAQVRAFFATDFKPSQVVIIRPRQLGPEHTYIIKRPGTL